MTNKYRKYLEQLTELRKQIDEDFDYYRKQNSLIDRRLNELGKRGNEEGSAILHTLEMGKKVPKSV